MTDVNTPEMIEVNEKKVSCGGEDQHPRIYLTIDPAKKNYVECPYCDRRFVYIDAHHRG